MTYTANGLAQNVTLGLWEGPMRTDNIHENLHWLEPVGNIAADAIMAGAGKVLASARASRAALAVGEGAFEMRAASGLRAASRSADVFAIEARTARSMASRYALPTGTVGVRSRASIAATSASSDILATPNRLQNKFSAWRRYEGDLSLAQWSKRYDQLQVNRLRGSWAESFGNAGPRLRTPYGTRIVDNAPAIEIKTGYQSATKFIRRQIIKDSYLMRTVRGYNPLWRFVDTMPSRPLLQKLDTFGIRYELPRR